MLEAFHSPTSAPRLTGSGRIGSHDAYSPRCTWEAVRLGVLSADTYLVDKLRQLGRRKAWWTMKNIRHSVVLVAVVAFVTLAAPSVASTAGAATVPTRHLPASGGTIKWAVAVHSAKTCTWSSSPKVAGFDGTARCTNGLVVRAATFKANTSTEAKNYTLTLVVRGKTTTVEHLTVVEAGKLAGARKLATTTSLGIVSGSVTTGYVFGVHVTDSNGPVSLPTRSIVFQVTTNYPQTGTPWSWTATTRTANQSSCTLDLFRESSYLDLTSSDCSVSRSAKIIRVWLPWRE